MHTCRFVVVLLLLVCPGRQIWAQVKPPEIRMILPEKGIYRFKTFSEGSIVYRNGIMAAGRLNYNVSLDEMHFISEQGDTLSVADPVTISFINLQGSRFYYDKGYLQTVDTITAGGIILAFKQSLAVQQQREVGAYGITKPHEGVRTMNFYTGNGQTYKLGADEKITVTAKELYFFGDGYNHFTRASKQFILEYFSKSQPELQAFIKKNHINFNVYNDLLQLMDFCRGLKQ